MSEEAEERAVAPRRERTRHQGEKSRTDWLVPIARTADTAARRLRIYWVLVKSVWVLSRFLEWIGRQLWRPLGSFIVMVAIWAFFLLVPDRVLTHQPMGWTITWVAVTSFSFALMVAALVVDARAITRASLPALVFNLLGIFSGLLLNFTVVYKSIGHGDNFGGAPLTKMDALYFALGTLTTAGTGALAATSWLARFTASAQMVLDLAVTGLALTVVVARLIERPASSEREEHRGEDATGASEGTSAGARVTLPDR